MRAAKIRPRRGQAHRKAVSSGRDPYLHREGDREMIMCRLCHAVYQHRRWYREGEMFSKEARKTPIGLTLCPACRKILDSYPCGVITLRGEFLKDRKDEILRLVRNEGARARRTHPLERIISVKDWGDYVEIQTTDEKLARRIGREVERVFGGEKRV